SALAPVANCSAAGRSRTLSASSCAWTSASTRCRSSRSPPQACSMKEARSAGVDVSTACRNISFARLLSIIFHQSGPEPGAGVGPVTVGAGTRDPHDICCFFDGQSGVEAQLDELGGFGVLGDQF